MPKNIISAPLTKPPRMANQLASGDNLLAAWQSWHFVFDENGEEYHFALHSPAWGWRGYRWDTQKYGFPYGIQPASNNIVWCVTDLEYALYVQIGKNGDVNIEPRARSGYYRLLYAAGNNCLALKIEHKLDWLYVGANKRKRLDVKGNFDVPGVATCASLLSDGTIALSYNRVLSVLAPNGAVIHKENTSYGHYFYFQPYFVHYDENNYLYYTEDPRKGWRKTTGFANITRDARIRFFTVLNNTYYAAFEDGKGNFMLYRSSEKSPECVDGLGVIHAKIQGDIDGDRVIQHNGLIYIAACERIYGSANSRVPDNEGFLVWDPIQDIFYNDVPNTIAISKIAARRLPSINIPGAWRKDILQQQ